MVTADAADTPEPDNIPLASKESRVEESRKRHDPFRGKKLDKDDLKYISQGHTLVDLQEHFVDDHTKMSGTELERKRQRRNALRINGKGCELPSLSLSAAVFRCEDCYNELKAYTTAQEQHTHVS